MGAFFGVVSKKNCLSDVFFGTDYHSHLGTKSGGVAVFDEEKGLQRKIHNLEHAPFRTKFEHVFDEMKGCSAIGCINDSDPQPLLIRSKLGTYAVAIVGVINNLNELVEKYIYENGGHFGVASGGVINNTELVASLINQKPSFKEGIEFAQSLIKGTASIVVLTDSGEIIVARDRLGRLPVIVGKNKDGYCISFESYAFLKLGYKTIKELGSGEIVKITSTEIEVLSPAKQEMKMCSFLWTYYGYPTSSYEGVTVETMRYKNGEILSRDREARGEQYDVDYVCGVPDSGTPHAIGYANKSKIPFARPYIKYTPTWSRSFTPNNQVDRSRIAKMKQIPVTELIKNKKLPP